MITHPDLLINENDEWIFENNKIINDEILKYFKKNLKKDDTGFYIENIFGEKLETAYLKEVKGFPLQIKNVFDINKNEKKLKVLIETGIQIEISFSDIKIKNDNCIYIYYNSIPVRFNSYAMYKFLSEVDEINFI